MFGALACAAGGRGGSRWTYLSLVVCIRKGCLEGRFPPVHVVNALIDERAEIRSANPCMNKLVPDSYNLQITVFQPNPMSHFLCSLPGFRVSIPH